MGEGSLEAGVSSFDGLRVDKIKLDSACAEPGKTTRSDIRIRRCQDKI